MKQIDCANDIRALGTILGVWAHPDDESFLAAGVMATAVANGQRVICVTATRGEAGVLDPVRWPPESLGEVRKAEMEAAMSTLGIDTHEWLGYRDGACHTVPSIGPVRKIANLIRMWRPDSILTFGPDGFTGHSDHRTVSRWVLEAREVSKSNARVYWPVCTNDQYDPHWKRADELFNVFFQIERPPIMEASNCAICYSLPPDVLVQKLEALTVMPSQTEKLLRAASTEGLEGAWASENFIEWKGSEL